MLPIEFRISQGDLIALGEIEVFIVQKLNYLILSATTTVERILKFSCLFIIDILHLKKILDMIYN